MRYTNSGLIGYQKISPNKTSPRDHRIDRITPHCYVGQVSIESMAGWLCNPEAKASANYGIADNGTIGLFVEEKDRSWCSSSRENDMRAVTIECASDVKEPYTINDTVYNKLLDLMTDICQRYNKPKLLWFGDRDKTLAYDPADDEMVITVHRWFANKACPGDYIYNRLGKIAETVTKRLGGGAAEPTVIYRVRLSWEQQTTQKGAFYELNNAIACADENPGYSVFDPDGKVVYTSAKSPDDYTPAEWIAMIAPITQDLAKKYAVLPSVVIAQTALETGWGRTDLTRKYNIVGMKADLINSTWKEHSTWDGTTYVKVTPEYINGNLIYKEDVFRVYKTFRECLEDYVNFLLYVRNDKGYKYRRLQGLTDPAKVIKIIRIGTGTDSSPEGYCTDPNYESKILPIIKEYKLTKYDSAMPGYINPPEETESRYRVQVGAYKRKSNADKKAAEVKEKTGFDCFVEKSDMYRVYCGSFKNAENAGARIDALAEKGIEAFLVPLYNEAKED